MKKLFVVAVLLVPFVVWQSVSLREFGEWRTWMAGRSPDEVLVGRHRMQGDASVGNHSIELALPLHGQLSEARTELRISRVDQHMLARLWVGQRDEPGIRQVVLTRIDELHGDDQRGIGNCLRLRYERRRGGRGAQRDGENIAGVPGADGRDGVSGGVGPALYLDGDKRHVGCGRGQRRARLAEQ